MFIRTDRSTKIGWTGGNTQREYYTSTGPTPEDWTHLIIPASAQQNCGHHGGEVLIYRDHSQRSNSEATLPSDDKTQQRHPLLYMHIRHAKREETQSP